MNNQQTIPITPVVYPSFTQQPLLIGQPISQEYLIQSNYPIMMTCPYCHNQIQTVVCHEPGNGAFIVGGALAAIGLWMGCCLIPCFLEQCKDSKHFCSQCNAYLGKKKFLCQ